MWSVERCRRFTIYLRAGQPSLDSKVDDLSGLVSNYTFGPFELWRWVGRVSVVGSR